VWYNGGKGVFFMNIKKKLLILAAILIATTFTVKCDVFAMPLSDPVESAFHRPDWVTPDDRNKALAEHGRVQDLMAWTEPPSAVPLSSTADADWLTGLKDGASGLWDAAKDKGSEIVDTVKEKGPGWIESAKDKAGDLIDAGKEKLPEVIDKAKDGLQTTQDKISQFREDQENQFWQWEDQMLNGGANSSNQTTSAPPVNSAEVPTTENVGATDSGGTTVANPNAGVQTPAANPNPNTANPQDAAPAQNPVVNPNSGNAATQDAAPVESAPLRSGIYTIDGKLYRYDAETNEWSEANPLPVGPEAAAQPEEADPFPLWKISLCVVFLVALVGLAIGASFVAIVVTKPKPPRDQ